METGKANNIQASTFKTSLCEQYHLSVQFGLKQFSYCIINRKTKYIEYFNNIIQDKNILEVINNDKNLKLEFKSSSVVFTNFPYTLVPNELFLKENSKKTLELNSDIFDKINTDKF